MQVRYANCLLGSWHVVSTSFCVVGAQPSPAAAAPLPPLLLLLVLLLLLLLPLQSPGIIRFTSSRLVRLLFACAPRIMRLFRLQLPRMGLVLQVDGNGSIVRTLGDRTGQKVWGVTSAVEMDGKLFLGSLHSKGVAVLDLNKVSKQ